jgi:ArsR family transcriptional regulator
MQKSIYENGHAPINPGALAAVREGLPGDEVLEVVVDTFDALADPTRAKMLYALGIGELCVRDLALLTGVSESAVSHQLRLLRDRRLVKTRRDGTTIFYSLMSGHLTALFRAAEFHADHVRYSSQAMLFPIPSPETAGENEAPDPPSQPEPVAEIAAATTQSAANNGPRPLRPEEEDPIEVMGGHQMSPRAMRRFLELHWGGKR